MELGFNASQYCGGRKEREILGNAPNLLVMISLTVFHAGVFFNSKNRQPSSMLTELQQLVQGWEL